jgi:hypothetical protein
MLRELSRASIPVIAGKAANLGGEDLCHQPDSRDATVRDAKGAVRKREPWTRLNEYVPRKRRNSLGLKLRAPCLYPDRAWGLLQV